QGEATRGSLLLDRQCGALRFAGSEHYLSLLVGLIPHRAQFGERSTVSVALLDRRDPARIPRHEVARSNAELAWHWLRLPRLLGLARIIAGTRQCACHKTH